MTDSIGFGRLYVQTLRQLVNTLEDLRGQTDMLTVDSSLSAAVTTALNNSGRTDLVQYDIDSSKDAVIQILFAFDSGDPPQKAHIYKML